MTFRTKGVEVGIAAIILMVVISGMWAAGFGPFARSSTNEPDYVSSAQTFDNATASALASAPSDGGPWAVAFVTGVAMTQPLPLKWYFLPLLGPNPTLCGVIFSPTVPWNETVPGFTGAITSGEIPGWIVVLENGTKSGILVFVLLGQPSILGSMGATCFGGARPDLTALPSNTIASPEAVSLALQTGGSTYLRSNPHANLTMSAPFGGSGIFPPPPPSGWLITLSTCPLVTLLKNGTSVPQFDPSKPFIAAVGVTGQTGTGQDYTGSEGCGTIGVS
jgi:hypothetical protein